MLNTKAAGGDHPPAVWMRPKAARGGFAPAARWVIRGGPKKGGTRKMDTDKIYAEHLANEYAPKDTSKVAALRRLDARAKLPATVFTYAFGIAAALLLGVGMCLTMGKIGGGTDTAFALGVAVGVVGLIAMGVNYPLYKKLLAKGRRKYASDIMELAREISEG